MAKMTSKETLAEHDVNPEDIDPRPSQGLREAYRIRKHRRFTDKH